MQILHDRNGIPYTEEEIENFLEVDTDDISAGILPEVTLSIRRYPKRYLIAYEVDWYNPLEPSPLDAEDAAFLYTAPKVYLWSERYLHCEFECRRNEILNAIKSALRQRYRKKTNTTGDNNVS